MLKGFLLSLAILCVGSSLFSLVRRLRYRLRLRKNRERPLPAYQPRVGLIVPCRGIDQGFEKNVNAFRGQNYDGYRLVFVTPDLDDPAHELLERIVGGREDALSLLVTSGPARGCSQKIVSLLKGVEALGSDVEVLVFADSDGRPDKDWLRNLVNPLQDPRVGAATSYRWYVPLKGGFWSALRAAWNGLTINPFYNGKHTFAWGGSTAIRKAVFDEVGVAVLWEKALSDDLVLTKALREAGYEITFVPQCLVASYEDSSFSHLWEWTTRQTVILRIYTPEIWAMGIFSYVVLNAAALLGVILCIEGIATKGRPPPEGILLASGFPLDIVNGYLRFITYREVMALRDRSVRIQGWVDVLLTPVASWLMSFNILKAATTNRIRWRGTTYELRSPTETIVLGQ